MEMALNDADRDLDLQDNNLEKNRTPLRIPFLKNHDDQRGVKPG